MIESSVSRDASSNRLGALALVVAERVDRATQEATTRSGSETTALVILSTELAGASQNTLGRVLALTQAGTARLVARMVRDGLVEQQPGPNARTHALVLTPAGQHAARQALERRAAVLDLALNALNERDLEQAGRIIDLLLAGLTDSRESALRSCRLCDTKMCGHPQDCPVTLAADAFES